MRRLVHLPSIPRRQCTRGMNLCLCAALVITFILIYWTLVAGQELYFIAKLLVSKEQYDLLKAADVAPYLPFRGSANDADINDTMPDAVPKIHHRMWKNNDLKNMPKQFTREFLRCKRMHDQYNYTTILWTDNSMREFIQRRYPWFLQDYDNYRYPIQRVDAARYFILYHYGGIYQDLDVGCARPLEPLRQSASRGDRCAILPKTKPVGISNDVMIATKNHPFFEIVIRTLRSKNRWYGSAYSTVMFSTGPAFLTHVHHSAPSSVRNRVWMLSPDLYGEDRNVSFFQHFPGSTWHSADARFVRWLYYFLQPKTAMWYVCFATGFALTIRRSRKRWHPGKDASAINESRYQQ